MSELPVSGCSERVEDRSRREVGTTCDSTCDKDVFSNAEVRLQNGAGQTLDAARQYVVQSTEQRLFLLQSPSATHVLVLGAPGTLGVGVGTMAAARLQYGFGHVLRSELQ